MHRVSKALSQPPEKKRKKKSELKARDSLYTTNKAIEAQAQIQMNSELQVSTRASIFVHAGSYIVHVHVHIVWGQTTPLHIIW